MKSAVRKALSRIRDLVSSNGHVANGAPLLTWSRVVMNRTTQEWVNELGPDRLDVLEISGTGWQDRGFRSYQSAAYPEFDICSQALPANFDLIIAEQVFEHLLWPYRAGRNVFQMVRPGGHFLMTTPFLYRIHDFPVDCSRWTELGVKHFLAECGFDIDQVRTGAWGNRECVKAFFEGYIPYQPGRHSLENEGEFPIVVWAMAQRGESAD
jgi:hypothetical protein